MIGIIDYGAGNVRSVRNALERIGTELFVSDDIARLQEADKVILPGVGEARSTMNSLGRRGLLEWLSTLSRPFLGICIGMQILFDHSEERATPCLGIVPGRIRRFDAARVKIPHIGWNRVTLATTSPLFRNIGSGEFFYFVHSYHAPVVDATIAATEYGDEFSAAVQRDNFYGVQFHAEKSGIAGLQILRNFVELC
jgi:glutamine amidotransferase